MAHGLEDRGIMVHFPAAAKGFSLLHSDKPQVGPTKPSYLMGTGDSSSAVSGRVVELTVIST
jgi:hypothetical protein